jgi:hypothetical protein
MHVCQQWRVLLTTKPFVSEIVVGSDATTDRVSSWLRNTGTTQIRCDFPDYTALALLEQSRELLTSMSRMTEISFAGTFDMFQPIFSGSAAFTMPNLVYLILSPLQENNGKYDLDFDQERTLIASVEMPRLEYLCHILRRLVPLCLRLFAPRLQILHTPPHAIPSSHFTTLGTCFPALAMFHMSINFLSGGKDGLIMPFPKLAALHLQIWKHGGPTNIPLLKDCPQLRDISLNIPAGEVRDTTFVLPPSSATRFFLVECSHSSSNDIETWLDLLQSVFNLLPNLRFFFSEISYMRW